MNFGRVESDYYHEPGAPFHRNRRKVHWLKTGVPRAQFSKSVRYEVGSAVTLFRVKNHENEFVSFVSGANPPVPACHYIRTDVVRGRMGWWSQNLGCNDGVS